MERMNYFPFTHGDAIEEQRKKLANTQKADITEIFKKSTMMKEEERKQRAEKSQINRFKQEIR